jgi:hypothetical protein
MEPSPSPSPTSQPTTNFKVIIVGGSIAGLTLGHCLAKFPNVDFVVLEKRAEIAPQEGASVGILPHGGRILDQLGLFEEILRHVEPLTTAHVSYPDGFRHTNRSPTVILERYVSLPTSLPTCLPSLCLHVVVVAVAVAALGQRIY